MTKAKVSIAVDPTKLDQARELLGGRSVSETIAIALNRSISDELDKRHIEGYRAGGSGQADDAWADLDRDARDIADDTDWAGLYDVGSRA